MTRLLDTTSPVALAPLPEPEVRAGTPRAGLRDLTRLNDCEIGVWEMTCGTAVDVEADEVFVVLSGSASVSFDDGETIDLAPGVVVRLRAGDRTTWVVRETLRKVYVA